jgi:hypothetical protein
MKMQPAPHTRTTRRAGDQARPQAADIDPDLERLLVSTATNEPIEAILILRREDVGAPCLVTPDSLLKRVCGSDPHAVLDSHYLPRLGVLIVRACPYIIRRLIAQPEVAIACANRAEEGQPAPAAKRARHKEDDR